jgi:hypothetical protein
MTPDIRGKLKKCGYRRTGEEVMTEEDAEGRLLKKVTRPKTATGTGSSIWRAWSFTHY